MLKPEDINIRTNIQPGDLGYVVHRHGVLYGKEYGFGVSFETYVGHGLHEFYQSYDPKLDRVWISEYQEQIVGFILLMHRENDTAQLRYFYLEPICRGLGLGARLMKLLVAFAKDCSYKQVYLWTTDELAAAHHLYRKFGFELQEERSSDDFGKQLIEQKYVLTL